MALKQGPRGAQPRGWVHGECPRGRGREATRNSHLNVYLEPGSIAKAVPITVEKMQIWWNNQLYGWRLFLKYPDSLQEGRY